MRRSRAAFKLEERGEVEGDGMATTGGMAGGGVLSIPAEVL